MTTRNGKRLNGYIEDNDNDNDNEIAGVEIFINLFISL